MGLIIETINPMDAKKILIADGTVKRVNIKAYTPGEQGVDEDGIRRTSFQGKTICASHKISILLIKEGEEVWVSLGDKMIKNPDKPVSLKQADGSWVDLVEGLVIRLPVIGKEYKGKIYYSGKLSKIVVLGAGEVPASAPKAQQKGQQQPKQGQGKQPQSNQQKPAQKGANDVLRIYGTITAIDGKSVTVDDQKIGVGVMVVNNPNQLKELVVGGRVAAVCDKVGNVLSGFKAYPPLENKTPRKSTYDPIGVSTGHALNAMQILLDRGLNPGSTTDLGIAMQLHILTIELKMEYAKATGNEEDAVGATVGNAVLNACRRVNINNLQNLDCLFKDIKAEANNVLVNLAEPLYKWIKTGSTTAVPNQEAKPEPVPEQKPEPQPEPQQNTVDAPPVEEDEPNPTEWAFDDDIPF